MFRKLCSLWISNGCKNLELLRTPEAMRARNKKITVTIGHKILAKKLSYARPDYIKPTIKNLVEKGYITYIPGTGVKGQRKNISQLSIFHLNIPVSYELPIIKKIDDATKAVFTISNMISLGVPKLEANLMVRESLIKKATEKAISLHSIEEWKKVGVLKKSLEAFKL